MEFFWVVFTVFLSLLTLSIHELGHVWALRRYGVPIEEISLMGMRLSRVPHLSFTYTFRGAENPTRIAVHPFLVGAYVKSDTGAMERLHVKDQAVIFGAGPFVNFLYSLIAFGLLAVTHPSGDQMTVGVVCFVLAALLLVFRTAFCRYGVLVVGVLLAGLILHALFIVRGGEVVGGPVTIVSDMSGIYQANAAAMNHFRGAVLISVIVSLALGTTNALPLPPFDGGQAARLYLSAWNKKVGSYFTGVGFILFLVLIMAALSTDIGKLVGSM